VKPPSAIRIAPVTMLERGDARNAITSAISSARAHRFGHSVAILTVCLPV